MKKFLLAALLLISGMVTNQAQDINVTEGPEYIAEVTGDQMFITGVSDNGRYCWGNNKTSAFYYDTVEGIFTRIKATKEELNKGYLETKIAGITDDGLAVVNYGKRECYVLNILTGEKTYIDSPLEDFPYFVAWDMTPDGKYIAGNCINKGNKQMPTVVTLQADGTYKLTLLDFDSNDAMGAPAQFTQARSITNDGKYIAGPQVSETGFVSRYVTWELNAEGVYEFKTPFDNLLYDFTKPQPGIQPTYYDFVTETDKESDEYKQQYAEYQKAFKEHRAKMEEFTRNYTNVDWGGVRTSVHGNYMCGSLKRSIIENEKPRGFHYPMFYDFDKQEIILIDSIPISSKGWEVLPGKCYMSHTGPDGLRDFWFKVMITENGVRMPFNEWIENKTGTTEISDFYYDEFMDTFGSGEVFADIYMGNPIISGDGKTMVTTTWMHGKYESSITKFSDSIFGDVSTGIETEVISSSKINGTLINAASAVVDVYTFDGMKVNTFNVAGSIDLADELAAGSYIVKVNEGKSVRSFKIVIR